MSELHKVGEIDAGQDLQYQRREWRVQRIGWIVMSLILLAALSGLLGRGPLSHATASNPDLELEYERVAHHFAPDRLELTIKRPSADTVGVWINTEYLSGLDLQSIVPEPIATAATDSRIVFYFQVGPNALITFNTQPEKFWSREGEIGLEGGSSIRFKQFIMP